MNILLLGAGGREHALAWKLKQSPRCKLLYIAPGNAGTSQCGTNVNLSITNFESIAAFCITNTINMVVVGPEEPLVMGIYDFITTHPQLQQVLVVGPSAAAAQLEGSKAFSKHFMQRHGIPTAAYAEFTIENFEAGKQYITRQPLPVVLKADGLAAGKGVVIATTHAEALQVFEQMLVQRQFGNASAKVVIEAFLQGIELSLFVLTNGMQYKIIGHAKDYKRIGDGDTGPNTGGMGCVSPVPFANEAFLKTCENDIVIPTIKGLQQEELNYHGFIFIGLMNHHGQPQVIEYNCRMGDPETEVLMPRLQNDLVELFVAMHQHTLDDVAITFDSRSVATVMAVSGGYPGAYEKGKNITGLNEPLPNDVLLFHAGTLQQGDSVVTSGGRVLTVSAYGNNIPNAVAKAQSAMHQINFEGKYYRSDIGYEFAE